MIKVSPWELHAEGECVEQPARMESGQLTAHHQTRLVPAAGEPAPGRTGLLPRRSRLALIRCTACWSLRTASRSVGLVMASRLSKSGTLPVLPSRVALPPSGPSRSPLDAPVLLVLVELLGGEVAG